MVPAERRIHANGRPMKAVQVVFRATVTGGALRTSSTARRTSRGGSPIAELPHHRHGLLVPIALGLGGRPAR